ncbi:Mitogen-activated protein kinase-binding protein 1 [Ogataea parapolymorpha DL-1]|uniref:Mitogen-activated protein kinase-binding protein 1 n=1 Tax=Ogataea parapolymorpha (strain ATCC 26012 / BCRC 20466 / JCM 22074 / NRRL Y-7560 / DL-1) TaxID=871575 RepID=W1QJM9_OGAPD|nr:Mitogen-activated protein kinase-binding protein 1 [Ogataea parapolymorpha DL-1]ESX02057.1 Mitogen-activated protein kinase-binding protein 1 [Ogataea parapolymorpha DL-1]
MSELTIEKIYGTSSETPAQFVAQDDYIAYTASGGVVVCKVDKELKVQWQKFFCANNVLVAPKTSKVDEYGFPLGGDPELISRDGSLTAEESRDNLYESPSARTLKIRKSDDTGSSPLANKVRSINCIAISPDKKLLAVGEVGYQPRILVYSLARNCSCRPSYIIQEHQFGINSLCFSTDSKRLCSLGLVNDGFLIVWKFTNKRFVFRGSNKCSSIVNKLFWHDDHIITIGLRHIKVWREDVARAGTILKGRNVLLKNFLNSNFIDIDCLNFSELIVMSDQGDLGIINLDDESIVLRKIYQLPSDTNQFKIDHIHEDVIIGGKELNIIPLNEVFTAPINDTIRPTPSSPTKIVKRSGIMALQPLFDFKTLVYLQDEQILYVDLLETGSPKVLISSLASKLNGLKRCFNGEILLWTKDGIVKRLENKEFVLLHSITLPPGDLLDNALSALDCSSQDLVLGDRFGTLVFLQKREDFIKGYRESIRVRAHESSINDIVMFTIAEYAFAASCSRDRTIQLFMKKGSDGWALFQTLTVHKGNVIKMLFTKNMLIALSSDRTLSVHKLEIKDEGPVLVQEKIISIKTSAMTFGVTPEELVVATNDKNIIIYSLTTFEYLRSMKLFNKNFDPLQVDNFEIHDGLMFTSSPDKCIRLFQFKDGKLLSSQWGHSETIIGLLFDSNSKTVMTASHDGCMFSWTLGSGISGSDSLFSSPLTSSNTQDLVSPPKVVRKIVSRPDLTPMKPSVQNKPSKSPSTVLPAAKLSANDSPTFTRTPSVCSAKQARSASSRSDVSPTSNVRSRLAGMRLDKPKPESASDIADKIVMDLRRLQARLLDEDEIDPSVADRMRVQMNNTMKLLPGHDENLLDQYGSVLVNKLVDALRKERDKENLENV